MAIIAVAGRKGGIGKSTIAGNLAAEFIEMGRSVVVIDADPQHSLVAWSAQGEGWLAQCVFSCCIAVCSCSVDFVAQP